MLMLAESSCVLKVGVMGIHFKTADLELREIVARGAQSLSDHRARFFPHPTVLLSTCNRTEIYFSSENLAEAHSDLLAYLRSQIKESFEHRLYSYFGVDCFAHLCRVAAGLDSAILAETEIQRQVKVAYGRSASLFSLPPSIHYIFQKALKVGKAVRSELELERGAPTLYGTLWHIASKFTFQNVLLIGFSEINRGFASFLFHKGVRNISLCTSSSDPIQIENIKIYDRNILASWDQFDFIVCASQADRYLLEGQSQRSHLIFDLSVPRNVDPKVGEATHTQLFNIEQVNQIIEQKRKAQKNCLAKCNNLILESVLQLSRIYRTKTLRAQETEEMGLHL